MKNALYLLMLITLFFSCRKTTEMPLDMTDTEDVCRFREALFSPQGYEIASIGTLDFNGGMDAFRMLDQQTGYALASNNVGGYAEVFKTENGGSSWTNLEVSIPFRPLAMVFRDTDYGLISVRDRTGCDGPDCRSKTVAFRTQDGGATWERIDYLRYQGALTQLVYDDDGILYANLRVDDQSVVLRSENDGGHWETLLYVSELDNSQSHYTLKSFRNEIWLCGREGRILVVDQNGNLLRELETGTLYFRDLEFIDEDNLILEASREILRSADGGRSWEVIYGESGGQVIGFDNPDNGLMIQTRNSCPVDYEHSNDLIVSTRDGGVNWQGPEETTTNFRYQYVQSQRLEAGRYLLLLRNELLEIREN